MKIDLLPSTPCHVLVEHPARSRAANAPGEILAFSKCRNEMLRIPAFLEHYRALGVDRFFIVDNDSSDGTADYLADQADVRAFRTAGRFSEARGGTTWLNALLAEFGVGSWCVTVDIDELLVYPGSDAASLHTLTRYLDQNGAEALACLLLDLYPDVPLRQSTVGPTNDPMSMALHFDPRPYTKTPVDACPDVLIRGGARERVFYPEFRRRSVAAKVYDAARHRLRQRPRPTPPCLTKVPLVRWDQPSRYLHCNHWVSRKVVARETGVLLHTKLLGDFHRRAVEEASRGEYYDGASEYRRYAEALRRNPDLTFMHDESVRFEGPAQLVRIGLMQETSEWAAARRAPSSG